MFATLHHHQKSAKAGDVDSSDGFDDNSSGKWSVYYECEDADDSLSYLHLLCKEKKPPMHEIEATISARPYLITLSSVERGDTPLHYAVGFYQSIEIIGLFLKEMPHSAKLKSGKNGLFGSQVTPLHIAIQKQRDLEVVKLIVDTYPKVRTAKDAKGNTPADYARTFLSGDALANMLVILEPRKLTSHGSLKRMFLRKRSDKKLEM